MGVRQYAKHRGVSHVAVLNAIKSGRVTLKHNKKIDPVKADQQWEENTSPDLRRDNGSKEESTGGTSSSRSAYAVSRAYREQFEARLAKLDFEERSGKLIDRSEVERTWFEKARLIRDGILNIPDRLASLLASVGDPHKVHQLLDSELRKALNDVADAIVEPVH